MQTARDHYMRCVELARQHGFGRIEVAHVGQRGWTRLYTGNCRGAKSDGMAAVNLAIRVGDRRAEMDDATVQEIQRLRDEAKRLGLKVAISALEEALSLT
jgi:hypothetical protein